MHDTERGMQVELAEIVGKGKLADVNASRHDDNARLVQFLLLFRSACQCGNRGRRSALSKPT